MLEINNGFFGYENKYVTIKKDDVVIDCGSNMGLFSNWAASKGAEKVISFEPGKTAYELCKKNISLYKNKIFLYPYAVSSFNEYIDFIECINIGGSHLKEFEINKNSGFKESYLVKAISLDDFLNKEKKIDFIKIDCEGSEEKILKGAENIIKSFSPKIVMACYHYHMDDKILSDILLSFNPNYKIKKERDKLFCWI